MNEKSRRVDPIVPIARGIRLLENAGLVIVLVVTLVAGAGLLVEMVREREAGIADLLLLFMYLEIVSMVETYWRMGKLPVPCRCTSRWWASRVT
jgi:protein PsiE